MAVIFSSDGILYISRKILFGYQLAKRKGLPPD